MWPLYELILTPAPWFDLTWQRYSKKTATTEISKLKGLCLSDNNISKPIAIFQFVKSCKSWVGVYNTGSMIWTKLVKVEQYYKLDK